MTISFEQILQRSIIWTILWERVVLQYGQNDDQKVKERACRVLLVPDRENLLPADGKLVAQRMAKEGCFATVSEALAQTKLAVRVESPGLVRALARTKPNSAVVHLLNYQYDAVRDDVTPLNHVTVRLRLSQLGVARATICRWVTPDAEPTVLRIDGGSVEVPTLGLWGLLVFGAP